MPYGRRHYGGYDPEIQVAPPPEPELPPVRGMSIELPGVYVAAADVAALLARYAEQYHLEGREALLEAAGVFADMTAPGPVDELSEPPSPILDEPVEVPLEDPPPVAPEPAPPVEAPLPEVDPHPDVDRVELYPDQSGTYWYARAVNAGGWIIGEYGSVQGIQRDQVETDARNRWPGKEIHELQDGMGDSRWDEEHATFGWNNRRRPSPRRLWANTPT